MRDVRFTLQYTFRNCAMLTKCKAWYRKYILREPGSDCELESCTYNLDGKCYKYSFELSGCPLDVFCGDEYD